MTTVIVTGAAGFIGRALCARLEREGVGVLKVGRGQPLPSAPGASCVHLAGSSDPARAAGDDARREAEDLARRVLAAGYARAVLASTAHVYGDASASPRREDEPAAPTSAYANLKLSLESLFAGPGRAVARLSNVYGPGQSELNAVSAVLRQFPGDGVVRLRGAADAVRDYLFVEDAAEGLARLALSGEDGAFNLSTGRGTTVAELVAAVARLHGSPRPRVEAPSAPPSTLVLDPGRAAARLGWKALTPLEQGLKSLLSPARP
jgi:UDP-glucose 4-epimerase